MMLPEGLVTGTVRGPDHAQLMRGDHAMSIDWNGMSIGAGMVYKFLSIVK